MSTFTLHLQSAILHEHLEGVASFIGEDASGSFGILAHHARFMTTLSFGLARFRQADAPWQYLAMPGALLYFFDNGLHIYTRRYLRDPDHHRIRQALEEQIGAEEKALQGVKTALHHLEEEMLHRLWRLQEGGKGGPWTSTRG
ncbi:F0F1 ATP synthase subunit epsilon [Acidithiobacillus sp.]